MLRRKHFVAASVRCVPEVQRHAKFTHEWTDSTLEPKFGRYRWADQSHGTITYIGDKVRFQNGFGAWQNMTYECDVDTNSDQVIAVRVHEGRL
jgi:hypothetical protein